MAGPGWFIAGDAAAALDPAAGTGIAFALNSGLAAGQAAVANAANGTSGPVVAARYDDALVGDFTTRAAELAGRYSELGISVLDGVHATGGRPRRPAVDFVH
jgi:flavin-dependent dehydrogenase